MGFLQLSRHDDDKHRRLIYQLRDSGCPEDRRLANVLAPCTIELPCRSAACIHCGRDFQRVAFDLTKQEISVWARRNLRGRMSALTLVPTEGCLAPGDLTATACRRVVANVVDALDACGLSIYALSLDISFNEDTTGKLEPHWCSHVHAQTADWLTVAEDKGLKKAFPISRLVSTPVKVLPLNSDEAGQFYIFKPDRIRRETYLNGSHPNRHPFRDSKRRTLRPRQAVQLAHVDHELGFEYRLITNGIDENAVEAAFDGFYRARDGP